jgi:hypothetical protein
MELDDRLNNGPLTEGRSCTDPFCCILFVVFIVGMFCAGIYGYANGDPSLLLTVYDTDSKLFVPFNYV